MKLWIYENHIRDVRSEELNEWWSSQLYPQLTNNLLFLPKCFETSSCFSFKASTEKLTCGLLHNTQSCYDWKINNIFNFWGVLTAVKPPVSDPTKCQDLRVYAFTGGGHPCEVWWKCSESQINCYVTYIYLSVYSHLSHKPKNENLAQKKICKNECPT